MDDSYSIITGNDLREGYVVYYTNPGWSSDISDAHVFSASIEMPVDSGIVGI